MPEQQANDEIERRSTEFKDMMKKAAKESDRGFVITTAVVLDFYLERVIKSFLIDASAVRELFEGAYTPLGDLSGKVKAAYVIGLITKKESEQINAVRKVRSIFAHEIDASFSHARVEAPFNCCFGLQNWTTKIGESPIRANTPF
jgi:DNA-binding MltR family transcriptional regulator